MLLFNLINLSGNITYTKHNFLINTYIINKYNKQIIK